VGAGKEGRGKEGSEFPIHLFESRAGREQDVQRRIEDRRTDTGRIPYGYRVTCPVQASAVGLKVPFPSAVLKALKPWR
jgi:hypothetical protein